MNVLDQLIEDARGNAAANLPTRISLEQINEIYAEIRRLRESLTPRQAVYSAVGTLTNPTPAEEIYKLFHDEDRKEITILLHRMRKDGYIEVIGSHHTAKYFIPENGKPFVPKTLMLK